jgi:hypothetical protein
LTDEFIRVRRELVEALPYFTPEAMKVYFCLLARDEQQKRLKIGLTLNELARAADVGTAACRRVLEWLSIPTNDLAPFIKLTKKTKHSIITLESYWTDAEPTPIPFTYDDTDATKLAIVEKQMRLLDVQYARDVVKVRSGLADVLKGEERDLILEIEQRSGRAITQREALLLGKCFARYGVERTKQSWRQKQSAKDPIRATMGALFNGEKGVGAQVKETQPYQKVKLRLLKGTDP